MSNEPLQTDYTISGQYAGYPVEIQVCGNLANLPRLVERLQALGITPPATPQPSAAAPSSTDAAPDCPRHHKPMKPMTKPDRQGRRWWCTCRDGADFCSERA